MSMLTLVFRWLVWVLLLTLESVVGLPWISFYVAGEWLIGFRPSPIVVSVGVVSIMISVAYSLPLSVSAGLVILILQGTQRTRKNTWQRLAPSWFGAIVVGVLTQPSLHSLTIISTLISFGLFFKLLGGRIRSFPWQMTNVKRSSIS